LMNSLPRGDRYDGGSALFASGALIEGCGADNARTGAGLLVVAEMISTSPSR
jgi:hypothetical protein